MGCYIITYDRVTLEFLSSLHTKILRGMECTLGLIKFFLFDKEERLNSAKFNDIFGFPNGRDK